MLAMLTLAMSLTKSSDSRSFLLSRSAPLVRSSRQQFQQSQQFQQQFQQ